MESALISTSDAEDDEHEDQCEAPLLPAANNFTATPSGSNPAVAVLQTKSVRRQIVEAALWLIVLVLLWTVNAVVFKKCSTVLINYSIFLALVRVALQLPFYFLVYWTRLRCLRVVRKETFEVPFWKFFCIGCLDSLANYMITFAAARLPGSLQSLLQQSGIPIVMISSLIILRARYKIVQWLGAVVILSGVFLVVYPTLEDPSRGSLAWIAVYIVNCVPAAFANMGKEWMFKRERVDMWHMQTMVAIGQLILSVIVSPIVAILPPTKTPANLPRNFLNAVMCLLGQDSYPDDHCKEAGYLFAIYVVLNFGFNMAMVMVLRTSSATVVSLASAFRLPLTNIAFTWVWLMGTLAQHLNMWDWLGLGVILFGLFLYSVLPPMMWKFVRKKFF